MTTAATWKPDELQLAGMGHLLQNANAGLFFDPGTGKTSTVLGTLLVLSKKKMFKRALVVAPPRVAKYVWPSEKATWVDFWNLNVTVLHGTNKDKMLEALPPPSVDTPDIVTVSFEGLDWLMANHAERFDALGADVLVVDESTYIKNTRTKRFKNLKPVLHTFARRIILTGTPSPNGYEDLFGQVYVVDRGNALGKFITHYRNTYFRDVGYGGFSKWVLNPGAEAAINAKIAPLVLRGDSAGIQRPALQFNNIVVHLPKGVRTIYDALETQFMVDLDATTVSAPNAAALGSKLRQVCNGFIYDGDKNATTLHSEKMDAAKELVDTLAGKPVFVLYEFTEDVRALEAALGYAPGTLPVLGPTCSAKDADQYLRDFNAGRLPVLVAHPASAGHGLNLQGAAAHVLWLGPTWNLEHHAQAVQRVWRRGNPNQTVTVHTIVAKDTIEERVAQVLRSKDVAQQSLLAAMRGGRGAPVPSGLRQVWG